MQRAVRDIPRAIILEINGKEEPFRAVWVHLQEASGRNSAEFRIAVPLTYAKSVFDPFHTKEAGTSWTDFIAPLIAEFGTFIVQGFIDNMREIVGERERAYKWVIASVDDISETEKGIELIGRVVPFINRS